jgi:acetate kinase
VRILAVNAGSSSLKLSILEADELVAAETLRMTPDSGIDEASLHDFIGHAGRIEVVGHRVVHGGTDFSGPVRIDRRVRDRLEALTDLAPLHQPKSLAALDAVSSILPDVPAVACFDTAFHTTIPAAAAIYALPAEWRRRWPIRRFGFHGLSHAYVSRRAGQLLDRPVESLRIVSCHLGAGASLAAVDAGRSVDTTMGFTPLEGLVMATRSGTVDPGLILWLEEHAGIPPAELASSLEHRSGLMGLAGTPDLQVVLDQADHGNADSAVAVDVYLHRLRAAIASMAAAMGGLDVIVFTGGVGEHSPAIRERAAAGLGFLGVRLDPAVNRGAAPDAEISAAGAEVRALVIEAREDVEIASQTQRLLKES